MNEWEGKAARGENITYSKYCIYKKPLSPPLHQGRRPIRACARFLASTGALPLPPHSHTLTFFLTGFPGKCPVVDQSFFKLSTLRLLA
jgi:hypothetical protein